MSNPYVFTNNKKSMLFNESRWHPTWHRLPNYTKLTTRTNIGNEKKNARDYKYNKKSRDYS
jgi:hypothetical protein